MTIRNLEKIKGVKKFLKVRGLGFGDAQIDLSNMEKSTDSKKKKCPLYFQFKKKERPQARLDLL